jgi:hypothetical protein
MLVGTGYTYEATVMLRQRSNFYPASFIGVPNNGEDTYWNSRNSSPNPYPSALFADAFARQS